MPLDQAVYSAANGAIYGVRGPWVFRFSATTGALQASSVFARDVIGESTIVAVGSRILVGTWHGTRMFYDAGTSAFHERDIFSINPTTLVSTAQNMYTVAPSPLFQLNYQSGWRNLVTDGTLVYGQWSSDLQCRRVRFDPANIAATFASTGNDDTNYAGDMAYDTNLSCLVFTMGGLGFGRVESHDATWFSVWRVDPVGGYYPVGVCYCSFNNCWYCTANTEANPNTTAILKVTGDGLYTEIPYAVAGANAHRLKYDSVTGKIYIANLNANSVTIFDPSSDTVESTQTGFSMPWDIVCTPTNRFAVQQGSVGLKEIV